MPDQVYNLLQDRAFLREVKCYSLRNKVADIPMNTIPAARSDMGIRNLQSGIFCHIVGGCLGNPIHDHGEVHNVSDHASNTLLAGMRGNELVGNASTYPLTSLDINHQPNPRNCLHIRSSPNYRQFNLLDIFIFCVTYSPRRWATSRHS